MKERHFFCLLYILRCVLSRRALQLYITYDRDTYNTTDLIDYLPQLKNCIFRRNHKLRNLQIERRSSDLLSGFCTLLLWGFFLLTLYIPTYITGVPCSIQKWLYSLVQAAVSSDLDSSDCKLQGCCSPIARMGGRKRCSGRKIRVRSHHLERLQMMKAGFLLAYFSMISIKKNIANFFFQKLQFLHQQNFLFVNGSLIAFNRLFYIENRE